MKINHEFSITKPDRFLFLGFFTLLMGCAEAPKTSKLVQYQTKSAKVLQEYAASLSAGYRGIASSNSSRNVYFDGRGLGQETLYQNWNQQNANSLYSEQLDREVQACRDSIQAIPADCTNLGFMISSLARCLDRIISHQNPIYTHAYRQLDQPGQQYWTYALDWRRPRPVQNFTLDDYQQLNPYAYNGWLPPMTQP